MNIGPDTPIYIYWYSNSVSCLSKNRIKMALAPKNKNHHNILLWSCEVLILLSHICFDKFLWVYIGTDTPISTSSDTDSVSWWSQMNRKMAIAQKIRKITTVFSSVFNSMDVGVLYMLWYTTMVEYWSSYTYLPSFLLQFSVFVIIE